MGAELLLDRMPISTDAFIAAISVAYRDLSLRLGIGDLDESLLRTSGEEFLSGEWLAGYTFPTLS